MGELWLAPSPPSGIRTLPGDPDGPEVLLCHRVATMTKKLISIETQAKSELEHHVGSGTKTVTWTDGRIEKGQKKRGEGEGLSDHPTDDCFFGEIGFVKRRRIHESGRSAADPLGRREPFNGTREGRNSNV